MSQPSVEVVRHDRIILAAQPDLAALDAWVENGAKALVNTRSTTWRGLDEIERARAETEPAALLAEHPTLIKRPVIEAGGAVHVGWSKAVEAALA